MTKSEWGTKRTCPHCGARFYDLRREPIVCPKCGTPYDAEVDAKPKRVRVVAEQTVEAKEVFAKIPEADLAENRTKKRDIPAKGEDEDLEESELEKIKDLQEADKNKEDDIIEDASELGEDKDDMAEVIENVGEEEER